MRLLPANFCLLQMCVCVCVLTHITDLALFSIEVELMLTDGHHPDGFDQRVISIPRIDHQTRLSERTLSHRSPANTQTHTRFRPNF